jgi:branched-chain amino acid transport system permease protein
VTMEVFFRQVCAGLATGGIYAIVALALVMIYKAARHVNFAIGEMATLSTFVAFAMINHRVPYWLAFVATLLLSFVAGLTIERLVIRRMEAASHAAAVIVIIGLLLIFNSLSSWIFGTTIRTFPSPFPSRTPFGITWLASHQLGALATTLALMGAVWVLFHRTSLGLALRATADNTLSSRLAGVRVGRMLAIGWGLSSAIGAVAGMMIAPILYLEPNMMAPVLLYGFAAALLGGIDNPAGAVVGGFLVGVMEAIAGAYIVGSELKQTVALIVIVLVLMFRPAGLFGQKIVVRV